MLGLIVFGLAGLFLSFLGLLAFWAWRRGARGGSKRRAFIYASIAVVIGSLPITYKAVPARFTHAYYCDRDGGVVVYQDPDEWLAKHQQELGALAVTPGGREVKPAFGWDARYLVNKLVAVEYRQAHFSSWLRVPVRRWEERVIDLSDNGLIISRVDYSTGKSFNEGGLQPLAYSSKCSGDGAATFLRAVLKLGLQDSGVGS